MSTATRVQQRPIRRQTPMSTILRGVAGRGGLALVALLLAGCTGGSGASPSGSQPGGGVPTTTASISDSSPSSGPASLPPACDLLSAAEVGAAIGKTVGEGRPLGTLNCDWGQPSDDLGVEVSLLTQPLQDEFCEPSLSGDPVTGFGRAGTWDYSDSFDVPQGSLSACVSGGLIMVTRTGHVGDASDEAGYRASAEELMTLVLGRL